MNKYATEGVNPATAEAQQRPASFAETLKIVGAQRLEFNEYGECVNHFWRETQAVARLLESYRRTLETEELDRRLAAIEEQLQKR